MYQIQTRYEYWSKSGKIFTKWFISYQDKYYLTLEEAEKQLKIYQSYIHKKLKLKYEYKIIKL